MARALAEERFDDARDAGLLLLGDECHHFEALLTLLNVEMRQGRPEFGLRYGDRAVRVAPDSYTARILLGSCLMMLNRFDDAFVHFAHGLTLRPHDETCLKGVLRTGLALGKQTELEEYVVTLFSRNPNDSSAKRYAGTWLSRLSQPGPRGIATAVSHDTIVGCVFDPEQPDVKWTVEAFVEDVVLARGKANLPDSGIAENDIGDGAFGFRLRLPKGVSVRRLLVRVHEMTSDWYGVPLCFDDLNVDQFEGQLNMACDGVLTGFALNRSAPLERVAVRFESNTGMRKEVKADIYDGNWLIQGKGDGSCGFRLEWPWKPDGPAFALISAHFGKSDEPLPGSPIVLHNPLRAADAMQALARCLAEKECQDDFFSSPQEARLALRYLRERLPLLVLPKEEESDA